MPEDRFSRRPADHTTLERLYRLPATLRSKGAFGAVQYLVAELRDANRLRGRLRRLMSVIWRAGVPNLIGALFRPLFRDSRELWLFYDLAVSPITYDICWALTAAEMMRRDLGLRGVRLVIVPGPMNGLRDEGVAYERAVGVPQRQWRVSQILLAAARQLPSLSGTIVCSDRREALYFRTLHARHVYPCNYTPTFPAAHQPLEVLSRARSGMAVPLAFAPLEQAAVMVAGWLQNRLAGRRLIVITLRNYGHDPERNSALKEWAAFASSLDSRQYYVVFVPESETAFAPPAEISGQDCCEAAAISLDIRMALYRAAYLNMFVNNGPHALCMFDAASAYLMFKILPQSSSVSAARYMEELGFELGRDPPFAKPWQHWVWEDDTAAVIAREFHRMIAVLESHQAERQQCGWTEATAMPLSRS